MKAREYMRRIEEELGKPFRVRSEWRSQLPILLREKDSITLPDFIVEDEWTTRFMKELSMLSKEYADELQQQVGTYRKDFIDGTLAYQLDLSQAPPTRMLSLACVLAGWLGWILVSHGYPVSVDEAKRMLQESFEFGRCLDAKGERP